jgi:hypothetical protein
MTTLTRDDTIHDVEYVTKHEAELEIEAANHRGMIAEATLRNELTSIKQELKHHLAAFDWMDGPEGWTESCQRLAAFIDANVMVSDAPSGSTSRDS